ncbi:uncharacterized protein LOC135107681 isoform X1 [Scylla paramamosain]|uniref:uncharacterized protein LOC135107681 isoform X1 n=1 Tax=Scylla paramamosain TaxID=85552 RepID=UPI003083AE6C
MDRVVLPPCLLLLLLLLRPLGTNSSVHVYEFQPKGQQSDSYLLYSKNLTLPPLDALTFCVRLRFYFLWEVSGFLQVSDDTSGNLVPTIQAEVNLNYIRVTLANFRRYHFLKNRLRALTWHHLCVTYGEGVTVSYLDGAEQDRHPYELNQNITGNHAKVGAWDKASSYSGQLSQVNLWSRALTKQEVAALAECRQTLEGNLIAWEGPWDTFGNVTLTEEPIDKLCQEASGTDYFVFTDFTAPAAFQVCEGLGGYVPTPESRGEYETIVQAVDNYLKNNGRECKPFWAGITDNQEEGVWTLVKHMSKLEPPWAVDEPDGSNLENCAVVEGPLKMADARCDEQQCVVCAVPRRPVWKLLGACERYHRNTHFVALQDPSEGFLFRGYSDYRIVRDGSQWLWWDWRNSQTVATLSSGVNGVPIGRQDWRLTRPMCGQTEGRRAASC